MKKLIIVGAGGCGREVLQWALQDKRHGKEWKILGFLDDDIHVLDGKKSHFNIIGTIEQWQPKEDEIFVCAIASPSIREIVVQKLKERGAIFEKLIHSTAIIATTAEIGEGVIIYPYTIVSDNTIIGDFAIINLHCAIGHDARIGQYSTISSFCDITGNVIVGHHVFMGSHVSIVPGVEIGNNAFLCAGSIIMNKVKPGYKMLGNPARKFTI